MWYPKYMAVSEAKLPYIKIAYSIRTNRTEVTLICHRTGLVHYLNP